MRERIEEANPHLSREEIETQFPILKAEAKPEIFPDLVWIWEGFTFLCGSRQMGMSGPQPLSLLEMLSYLTFRGIQDPEERSEFVHLCQYLDRHFMADAIANSKKNSSQPSPKAPPRKTPR